MLSHMPVDTTVTHPSLEAPRSSSILSRFSSPISKRSRNVFDVTIEPKDLYRTYTVGDTIYGQVELSVAKGFDITHLTVSLQGYAKVFKHQSDRRPSVEDLNKGQRSKGFEYLGNGLASLFQDEQVLCGSGFLKKQIYKFGFELQFPTENLPSTIEFERGAVGYMISATVTRPTAIAPTTTKTIAVQFKDRIDIESLYSPKSRVISLEPIKRGKVKKVKTNSSMSTLDASSTSRRGPGSNHTSFSNQGRSTVSTSNPPLSPAPSEETIETTNTTSTGDVQVVEHGSPVRRDSPHTSETRSSRTSSLGTITATVEIPRHGVIPGDTLPISVSVSHTKPNVRGVIIATLYRTIRIDMHPVVPVSTKGKARRMEHEDIYPRSRTGLGGLYFTSSSPSTAFRKDLSQSSTLMVINPHTLTADVKTSVKIPVDSLPTMTNIPGGMISFSYHIEVVIDLAGKLGEFKILPSLTSSGPTFSSAQENGNQVTSDWAHNILDTTSLRRTKSVVTSVLPLIIGTKDSRRERRQADVKAMQSQLQEFQQNGGWDGDMYGPDGYDAHGYWNEGYYYDEFGNPIYDEWYGYDENYDPNTPLPYVPPPESEDVGDEKTRLRRQEELLMPSQPPEPAESSVTAQALVPTAPSFVDGSDIANTPLADSSSGAIVQPSMSRASARSGETIIPGTITPPPSLPDDEQSNDTTEDKQELERRRLMAQASAPPVDAPDAASSSGHAGPSVPTAPVINEGEEYISRVLRNERFASEALPQYQR